VTECAFCQDEITWCAYRARGDDRDYCDALCAEGARKLRNQVEQDFRDVNREKRLAMGRG